MQLDQNVGGRKISARCTSGFVFFAGVSFLEPIHHPGLHRFHRVRIGPHDFEAEVEQGGRGDAPGSAGGLVQVGSVVQLRYLLKVSHWRQSWWRKW